MRDIDTRNFSYVIREDNDIVSAPCPVCGEDYRPDDTLDVYVEEGSSFPVCYECKKTYAPKLLAVLEAWGKAQGQESVQEAPAKGKMQ